MILVAYRNDLCAIAVLSFLGSPLILFRLIKIQLKVCWYLKHEFGYRDCLQDHP